MAWHSLLTLRSVRAYAFPDADGILTVPLLQARRGLPPHCSRTIGRSAPPPVSLIVSNLRSKPPAAARNRGSGEFFLGRPTNGSVSRIAVLARLPARHGGAECRSPRKAAWIHAPAPDLSETNSRCTVRRPRIVSEPARRFGHSLSIPTGRPQLRLHRFRPLTIDASRHLLGKGCRSVPELRAVDRLHLPAR
jgi:hypothetical protein